MTNKHDLKRNAFMLNGSFAKKGYDWWWHSFTAVNEKTGEEKPFFIEFFTCNPAKGGDKPIFGQLTQNKENGIFPSYLMIKAGWWGEDHAQLHRFFGWSDVKIHKNAPYSVSSGDCFASDTKLSGKISVSEEECAAHPEYMCDAGTMEWNLTLDKQIAFNVGYGAGAFFRAIKAFEMYWHAEGIKTVYSGTIVCNGEKYNVLPETSYGYADKNWGRGFTSPWVWLSSCNLVSKITGEKLENSAFDIGGGRPKVYFMAMNKKLLASFTYKGEDFEFNFSKFWTGCKTEFSSSETDSDIIWHVRQETKKAIMETDVTCKKKDMLNVNYEAPDGSKRHNRLWNGGNGTGEIKLYRKKGRKKELVDDVTALNIGCEYGVYS